MRMAEKNDELASGMKIWRGPLKASVGVLAMVAFASCSMFKTVSSAPVPLNDCVIYYDHATAPSSVDWAAREIQKYVELSTETTLPIVDEPKTPMICLGDNATARDVGLNVKHLPWEGSRIATLNGNLYIVGRDLPNDADTPLGGKSYGTLYGAFTFLERVLGVRWLMPGEHGTRVPKHDDLVIPEMNLTDAPGFEFRKLSGVCNVMNEWYAHQRFDQNVPFSPETRPIKPPFPKSGRAGCGGSMEFNGNHSWDILFPSPKSRYADYYPDRDQTFRDHPEYFELSPDGRRVPPINNFSLCLSNPDVDVEVANRVGAIFDNEKAENLSIFPNDATPRCACPHCQAGLIKPDPKYFVKDYPSESAWSAVAFNHFRNVAEHLLDTHPGKTVSGGCYYKHETPYEGVKRMPDNFIAYMAPVRLAYGPMRLNPENNQKWHALLENWSEYAPNMIYYGVDFWLRDYTGAPNPPCLDLMTDTFDALRKLNYRGAYFYGNLGYGKSSLVNYMLAKLMWDPSRPPMEVLDEFCDAAYGSGSDDVKGIYLIADRNMAAFIKTNIKDKIDYNMYPEMLRDVYGKDWKEIERRYLSAKDKINDEGCRWRLEQLGENLKLLSHHLTRLGLVKEDETSPFHMTAEQYRDQIPAKRWAPWPVTPVFANNNIRQVTAPVSVEHAPPIKAAESVGPFKLRYHQDVLLAPTKDGMVLATINQETAGKSTVTGEPWLPDIPYFSVSDQNGKWVTAGIADQNGTIQFPGKKGEHYFLLLSGCGRYRSGTRYGFKSDVPHAFGDKTEAKGLRFQMIETPLYFHVPRGTGRFNLYFSGQADAEILDPNGKKTAVVKCDDYQQASHDATGVPAGFWTIKFLKKSHVVVRQDGKLSGYFTVNPSKPLAITPVNREK